MGVHAAYDNEGRIVLQPDSYKSGEDTKLTTFLDDAIRQSIKMAAERGKGGSKLEKAVATVTRKDGSVSRLSKAEAIGELARAADTWELRALEPGLDKDVKAYLLAKSRAAKDEIAHLEGQEPVAKSAEPARPVSFTLPR